MLSLGPLLSDLSADAGHSVADRFWPFVLIAFLFLVSAALFFALRSAATTKKDEGDEPPPDTEDP